VAKPRQSRRTLTTLIVLILVSVTVISLDESGRTHDLTSGVKSVASDVFSPLRSGVNSVLEPIGNFFAATVDYGPLLEENHKLRARLGALEQQVEEKAFAARQLQELLALQKLPYLNHLPTVTAQTQSIDVSNFATTIGIDKGRAEGVTLGDPVVGAGGLVGQVVEANHGTAVVRLITDGQSRVGVTFGNQKYATVDGQGPGTPMAASFIAPGTKVRKGEQMFTNGLQGAAFPPGIPVAFVTSVHTPSGADQEDVQVQPLANLDTLAYVDVVQWSPSP